MNYAGAVDSSEYRVYLYRYDGDSVPAEFRPVSQRLGVAGGDFPVRFDQTQPAGLVDASR